jgi:hypothetical protein
MGHTFLRDQSIMAVRYVLYTGLIMFTAFSLVLFSVELVRSIVLARKMDILIYSSLVLPAWAIFTYISYHMKETTVSRYRAVSDQSLFWKLFALISPFLVAGMLFAITVIIITNL